MALGLSSYLHQALAAWINGTTMPTAPAGLVMALSAGDPKQDASGLVEPNSAFGYARQPVTMAASAAVGGGTKLTSTNAVVFGPATSGWPTITHGALFDSGGNMLASGPLGVQRSAPLGDTVSFAIGAFQFTLR